MRGVSCHFARSDYGPLLASGLPSLPSTIFDSAAVCDIARTAGFVAIDLVNGLYVDKTATVTSLETFLTDAESLVSGDYVIISFDGHGIGLAGGDDAHRGWVLWKSPLTFAKLYEMLDEHLVDGVRVLIISNSCHSGLVKEPFEDGRLIRELPITIAEKYFEEYPQFFELRNRSHNASAERRGSPTVIHLSACAGNQKVSDGGSTTNHNPFVKELLAVIGNLPTTFAIFLTAIQNVAPKSQQPQLEVRAPEIQAFDDAGPFHIV